MKNIVLCITVALMSLSATGSFASDEDSANEYYIGFTLERVFTSEDASMSYQGKGIDNSNDLNWDTGTPPIGSPYAYVYRTAADYYLSRGLSSSFEAGWRPFRSLLTGIEFLYMNNFMLDDDNAAVSTSLDVIALMANVVALVPISQSPSLGLYFAGALGIGNMSIARGDYEFTDLAGSTNPPLVPASVTPGAYVRTNEYPAGSISRGYTGMTMAYQFRTGFTVEKNSVFASLGIAYFGLAEVDQLKNIRQITKNAIVALEDDSASGATTIAASVTMDDAIDINPIKISNIGLEFSIRLTFKD